MGFATRCVQVKRERRGQRENTGFRSLSAPLDLDFCCLLFDYDKTCISALLLSRLRFLQQMVVNEKFPESTLFRFMCYRQFFL